MAYGPPAAGSVAVQLAQPLQRGEHLAEAATGADAIGVIPFPTTIAGRHGDW
jgi:hypothetical protein